MLLLSWDCAPEQDLAHDCLYLIAIYQGGKEARFVFLELSRFTLVSAADVQIWC